MDSQDPTTQTGGRQDGGTVAKEANPKPSNEPWYSARCIFRHDIKAERPGCTVYEERVVLFQSSSFEEALRRAKAEATDYASLNNAEFVQFVEVYHLFDRKIRDGTEVFSLLRDSELPPKQYVTRFFDTGTEYREKAE